MNIKMRRKDREMDEDFGLELIDRCDYGTLSITTKENEAYAIPLSIVRKDRKLYFHSAKSGKKVSNIEDENRVCVVFVGERKIPNNFTEEELDRYMKNEDTIAKYISSVFTTEFESVIVYGRIRKVENREKQIAVLKMISEKYTEDKMEYFDLAVEKSLDILNIYEIDMDRVTSKRKKYDEDGVEMKWGRMK